LALKVSQLLPKQPKVTGFQNLRYRHASFEDTEIEFVGAEERIHFESRSVVENGTLEDDRSNRDFTINAGIILEY
jgi:tRNA nucleotidyltransferase (CCA-adding enzyme)